MKKAILPLLLALLTACAATPVSTQNPTATPPAATEAPDQAWNEVCDLYLQVLEDLWAVDPALSADIAVIGLDLSAPGRLSQAHVDELAARFGAAHGLEVVQGSWQELADAGYIDAENLYWEDGCLFTVTVSGEGDCGMPDAPLVFDAEKWRSGLGAVIWTDCRAEYEDGGWAYEIGAYAVA